MKENSIEEDIKMIEILKNKNLYINIKPKSSICIDCINKNKNKHIEAEVVINEKLEEAINYTLSNYKRVLKENEELNLKYYMLYTGKIENLKAQEVKIKSQVIPVQKVKDKIRYYQELQDNYIKKYDEINEGLQAMINVLQELLEGRK